jgi:hypothetical protein
MKNKYAGSSFADFLSEEKIIDSVDATAIKRSFVVQLERRMKQAHKNKMTFRRVLGSPTTTARLFSDNPGTELETIVRAAAIVECDLEIRLRPKYSR